MKISARLGRAALNLLVTGTGGAARELLRRRWEPRDQLSKKPPDVALAAVKSVPPWRGYRYRAPDFAECAPLLAGFPRGNPFFDALVQDSLAALKGGDGANDAGELPFVFSQCSRFPAKHSCREAWLLIYDKIDVPHHPL
jgi:hypothetical protein